MWPVTLRVLSLMLLLAILLLAVLLLAVLLLLVVLLWSSWGFAFTSGLLRWLYLG